MGSKLNKRNLYHKRVFTTGEVAKILHVSQMSVIKWFNDGRLDGYRVPIRTGESRVAVC
ncbi:MAG: hypothetical protein U5N86_02885 [Planctomycetota bacterium]|nr:hypothetical protein [Planctomycetota bacterium]